MQPMETLSETINRLRKEGYTVDFNLEKNSLVSGDKYRLFHNEFIIDQYFRFEGQSDPADEATVYAISAPKHNIKGVLVNGAGIYTDDLTDEMLETLRIKER